VLQRLTCLAGKPKIPLPGVSTSDPQPPTVSPALFEGGLEPYLRAVRRRPLVVAAVALVVVLAAGIWLLAAPRGYRATTQVLVTPLGIGDNTTYTGLPVVFHESDESRSTETATTMLDSNGAAAATAKALGRGWSAARVRSAVDVSPLGGANVVAIQARSDEPGLASVIAATYARAVLAQRRHAMARTAAALVAQLKAAGGSSPDRIGRLSAVAHGFDPTFVLVHAGAAPASRAGPSVWRVLASALLAGAVLGIGVALLVDALARRRAGADAPAAPGDAIVRELPRREDRPRT
jgi:uncharacterized protein involved in exopolysaccharide biosynthesis